LQSAVIKILRDWATTTWFGVQPIEALIYAEAIVNFSNLIRSFPHGNIATNLEIAIAPQGSPISVKAAQFLG
jgi:hypothetical protein